MSSNFRHIVRVAGTDLDGYKKLGVGLIKIKGVGLNLAKVVIQSTGLDPNIRIGLLNDNQIRIIRDAIENVEDQMVPNWMLNRQKDLETGQDLHKIGPNLILTEKNDIDSYNINSVTAKRNDDGSVTVNFGGCGDGRVNCLPIMEGWNYAVRYYRPRKEVIEGKYKFPKPKLAP